MANNMLAFADEYGNNSFEFGSQGSHFIVASVLIKDSDKPQIEKQLEEIREKFFQKGEIKSKKVADNVHRRIAVLKEISKLDFKIFAIVVDKRKLLGDGFAFKRSFYKFVCGLVYKELFKTFPQLTITVDEHGGNDFMLSFKKYVESNHVRELFSGSEFIFDSSRSNLLIQLADFVAGTIGRCYDATKKDDNLQQYLQILGGSLSDLRHFPIEYSALNYTPSETEKNFNYEIAKLSTNLAADFIETKKVESPEDIDQVNLIRLLLLYQKAFDPRLYVSTKELIRHLQTHKDATISEQYFRTRVIGKIRDAGVLIASSSHGEKRGYKLPTSLDDIYSFINHGNSQILPMLERIKKCRDKILLATSNQIDILSRDNYTELASIVKFIASERYIEYAKNRKLNPETNH